MPASLATSVPLVSVIVRSMDRASLLDAVQSVVMQDHRPIELLLVNALGHAHSALPEEAGDLKVRQVADETGRPLRRAAAAQAGLQAATGDWILYLDDDDTLLPGHLGRLVRAGQANVEMHWLSTLMWKWGAKSTVFGRPSTCLRPTLTPCACSSKTICPSMRCCSGVTGCSKACKFDTSLDLFEDWDFWLQLAELGHFVRVPGVSARYVVADSGHSAVFEDSPAARQARESLFDKWRQRLDSTRYIQLLARMQSVFRKAAQLEEELSVLQRGHAEQSAVLDARDAQLADYAYLLSAREAELASARIERESQQLIRVTREQELANALAAIEALRELLKHRESEVQASADYASSLRDTLSQREREVADGAVYVASLRETLTQREREISEAADCAASLRERLAQRERELAGLHTELASLHAERPLQALARTLRSKSKPHASRT
jgi:hypothetical protein